MWLNADKLAVSKAIQAICVKAGPKAVHAVQILYLSIMGGIWAK